MLCCEAEGMHLLHRLFSGPALSAHAKCRNHHSGPVITQPAVHEDLSVRIFLDQVQEAREYLVPGKGTVPSEGDITHPQLVDQLFISFRPASVHHNVNPHFGESVESLPIRMAATIEHGRNLSKIRNAFKQDRLPHGSFDMGRWALAHLNWDRL